MKAIRDYDSNIAGSKPFNENINLDITTILYLDWYFCYMATRNIWIILLNALNVAHC